MRFRSSFLVALVLIALSFLISHSEAEAITLYSPSNGASLYKGNSITFDWGSVSGASYYEIWIDNHSSFGSPEVGFNNGVSPNWVNNGIVSVSQFFLTTSMQAQLPQNVYYWKVRALNSAKNDISGWSSIRSFSLLLKTPTGLNVVYQSANNWNYITWNSVFGATSYKIYWGTSSNVTTSSNSLSTGSTNYAHSGVVPGYCYYYKVAAVDSGGQSSLSSVDSACIPALKPDLVVQNQSASPTTVEAGSLTYISCTVKNQGSGSAASSYIKYYLSSNSTYDPVDTYFTSDYVSILSSGGTSSENATVTIPSGTSTGTKYILFYADKDGSVSESIETNNVAYKAITVIDPVNPQVNVSPTTGPQGTTFTETGSGFTKNNTATLYFDRPGLGVITLPVNTDSNGAYTNLWLCDACPIGTYSYWAIDDATGQTSNTVSFTVYAVNPHVSVSPSSGLQGTTFQQPGTGFTRNSTATLHFTGPDGPSTDNENTDSNGAYSHSWLCDQCPVGTYSYYAVDDATGQTSNTVYFTVTSDSPVFVPFYRLYKYDEPNNTRDHFYTTNLTERDNAVNTMGYVDEGIECYVSNRSFPGGVPLFRLYKGDANSHFYTTSETEKDIKIIEGYVYEGIQCFVNQDPAEGFTSLHRLKQETGTPYHYFLSAKTHEYETVKTMGYAEENPDGIGYVQLSIAREPTAHGRPQANYGAVDLGSGAQYGPDTERQRAFPFIHPLL